MPCTGEDDYDDDDAGVVVVNPDQRSKSRPNSSRPAVDHAINYVNGQPRVKHSREIKKEASILPHPKKPMEILRKEYPALVGNERSS